MFSFLKDLTGLIVMIDTPIVTSSSSMYVKVLSSSTPLLYYTCYHSEPDSSTLYRSIWKVWMVCKGLYMSEPVVSSEGKHYTDLMLRLRRSDLARPATAGQSGAACVVVLGRKTEGKGKGRKIRSQSTEKRRSKYMLLKPLKKGLKVKFLIVFFLFSRKLITYLSLYYNYKDTWNWSKSCFIHYRNNKYCHSTPYHPGEAWEEIRAVPCFCGFDPIRKRWCS